MSTLDKTKDYGEVLVFIFASYGWFMIWKKAFNFADGIDGLHNNLGFILIVILFLVLLLGVGIIYRLGTKGKYR